MFTATGISQLRAVLPTPVWVFQPNKKNAAGEPINTFGYCKIGEKDRPFLSCIRLEIKSSYSMA
jgi:hypothetical protein